MKTFNVSIVLLCLLATQPVHSQEIRGTSGDFETTLTKSFHIGSGGKLEIQATNTDIQISSWDQNRVEIKQNLEIDAYTRREAAEIVERVKNGYTQKDNTISIRTIPRGRHDAHNLEIRLPRKFDLDINLSNGDISVLDLQGDLSIRTSQGDMVLSRLNGNIDIQIANGDLELNTIEGMLNASTAAGDIKLRNIDAKSELKTAGGDIELEKAGNDIALLTAGGDIEIAHCEKSVTAKTRGGDITISHVNGDVLLETAGGKIEMENINGTVEASSRGGEISGTAFQSRIKAETMGGEIILENVNAGASAKTLGGDIVFKMSLSDFSRPHAVDLETSGGSIHAELPAKLPAFIHAEILLEPGKSLFKRFDIYSDFPLTKSPPDENGEHKLISRGEINGGGDKIILKAKSGDIYIQKR